MMIDLLKDICYPCFCNTREIKMSNKEENNKNTGAFNLKEPAKNFLDFKLEEDEKTLDSISNTRFARRMRSTYITTRPNLFLEEKEDIVINLFKKQRKLNNYSENKESISFSERQNIFSWCLSVLEPLSLEEDQKTSIFHRFCTAYDFVMDKLYILKKCFAMKMGKKDNINNSNLSQ